MTEYDKYLHLVAGKQYPALQKNDPPMDVWNNHEAHEYIAGDGNVCVGMHSLGGKPITKVRLSQALIALGNAEKFMREQQMRIENLKVLIAEGMKQ